MVDFELKKGYYIVTGGLGFLGKQHCEAISKFGGTPIILDIIDKEFELFEKFIKEKYSVKPIFYKVDITNEVKISKTKKEIIKLPLKVRGLINNAARNPTLANGGLEDNFRLENFDLNRWNMEINVGLTGAFLCTKHFGQLMNKQEGGAIVNISSDLGLIAPNQNIYKKTNLLDEEQSVKPITYSVIKSGLIGLTRYTATYWPDSIRCNCLCPGGVFDNQPNEFLKKINELIPMGRMAEKNEYAGALIFMLSNASTYMNGSVLTVDGGRTCW